jgi:hypothetical protein
LDSKIKHLLDSLAGCLITQDYESAEAFLAMWLRDGGTANIASAAKRQTKATRDMWFDHDLGDADSFELDDSLISVDELRENSDALPAQISAGNFKGWFSISVQSDEGEWSLYDFWCAVVEDDGQLVVGYYEIEVPD